MNIRIAWPLAVIMAGGFLLAQTTLAQSLRPLEPLRQSELREMLQQFLKEPEPDRFRRRIMSTPAAISLPEIKRAEDGLWYNLGHARIDGENYLIGKTSDRSRREFLDEHDKTARPALNPYYFPIKGQLTAEFIRRYCTEQKEDIADWQPVLERIEAVVRRELATIHFPPRKPVSRPENEPFISRPDEEPLATLYDCDDLICRIVLGHLDELARSHDLVARQMNNFEPSDFFDYVLSVDPDAPPPTMPLFGFTVKLLAEPIAKDIYCISAFRFRCLLRIGKERDFKLWNKVQGKAVRIAGACHFAAVWQDKDGRIQCSDYEEVVTISGSSEVRLTPSMPLSE